MSISIRSSVRAGVDALVYSGVWAGAAAGALTWAVGRTFSIETDVPRLGMACMLAFAGTTFVYAVDRLRDLDRDATTSPARTAFVMEHRRGMAGLAVLAAAVCGPVALALPPSAWGLCGAVLMLGLFHRRLKVRTPRTLLYVSLAWVAIVVGLPLLLVSGSMPHTATLLGTTVGVWLAIGANVIASEQRGVRFDADVATRLRAARRAALASWLLCLLVPGARPLALVGAAVWLSVVFFRPDERHGLVVLDGALLVGSLAAASIAGGSLG